MQVQTGRRTVYIMHYFYFLTHDKRSQSLTPFSACVIIIITCTCVHKTRLLLTVPFVLLLLRTVWRLLLITNKLHILKIFPHVSPIFCSLLNECHYLKTYTVLLYSFAFVDGKIFNGSRLVLPEDIERQ